MTKNILSRVVFSSFLLVLFLSSCRQEIKKEIVTVDERIVTLNGTFSEILYGLGLGKNIVAVDLTSNYPDSVMQKPNVGYSRNLAAEQVIAHTPNRVFAFQNILKPEIIEQFKTAHIQTDLYEELRSIDATKNLIKAMADTFHRQEEGMALIKQIDEDLKNLKSYDVKPKVLFIYARGAGSLMVAGKNTAMYSMVELAGGQNAVTDFESFKPLTPESLVVLNPDAILMFTNGLESLGGMEGIKQIPGIEMTNAGKNKAIIEMDGQLLSGFGVRVGRAVVELNKKFSTIEISKP